MTDVLVRAGPGGKADGLRELPPAWVPPFFELGITLHSRWLATRPQSQALSRLVEATESGRMQQAVSQFGRAPEDVRLIVRSNARGEGLDQRGLLRSYQCDGTAEGILAAAERVFQSAVTTGYPEPIGLIIQIYYAPVLWGHLSNERRVAEETRRWLCEMHSSEEVEERSLPSVCALRVERTAPAGVGELRCATRPQLLRQLRGVGRYFHDRKLRRHLEWLWDGARVWIVQNDDAPDQKGSSPEPDADLLAGPVHSKRLRVFRPFTRADATRWQKLECVQTFKVLGLPTTQLFILKGAKVIRGLAGGQRTPTLTSDLRELTKGPLVVRTDIAHRTTLFAPRTDALTDPRTAVTFLQDSARQLLEQGAHASEVCFIAHRFIPASASAFSLARRGRYRVRVDSLWGLPDGLEFSPHDSFEVDARTGSVIERRIRYKPSFLAALASGEWKVAPLAAPWDWQASLDDETLGAIASGSARLSQKVRKTIVIMWFAGVPTTSGHPKLIPWRYTAEGAPRQVESAVSRHFRAGPFYARNDTDIDRLEQVSGPISSVMFRPDGPHVRNTSFLKRLGSVVKRRAFRIDLEGSPLSHSFYVLRRTGANVACVDPINPKAVRRKFEKLVRDRIPVRIRKHGERVQTITLPQGELLDVLKVKLVEEALEALWASSPQSLQEEMADVMEVLRALSRATRRPVAQLIKRADLKRRSVGGFGKGLVLVETEDTPLIEVSPAMGLFGPGRVRSSRDSHKSVVAAGRRPKTRRDRLIVPLIASPPSRFRGPTRIYFKPLGLTLEVWYKEKFVEIVLEEHSASVESGQLSLPFEPSAQE